MMVGIAVNLSKLKLQPNAHNSVGWRVLGFAGSLNSELQPLKGRQRKSKYFAFNTLFPKLMMMPPSFIIYHWPTYDVYHTLCHLPAAGTKAGTITPHLTERQFLLEENFYFAIINFIRTRNHFRLSIRVVFVFCWGIKVPHLHFPTYLD